MGNEIGYLAGLAADMQYLKAAVGRLMAASSIAGTAAGPTIDFAVDMFDRADSSALNGYWSDTNGYWTLRSGQVICQGPATVPTTSLSSSVSTVASDISTSITGQVTQIPVVSGAAASMAPTFTNTSVLAGKNMYQGVMSSSDVNVKITFNIPFGTKASLTDSLYTATAPGINTVFNGTAVSVAENLGIVVGDSSGHVVGPTMALALPVDFTVPGVAAGIVTQPGFVMPFTGQRYALGGFTDFLSFFNSFASLVTPSGLATLTGSAMSGASYSAIYRYELVTSPPSFAATGNTLLLTAVGNIYTVYLNGVQLYTITNPYLVTRTSVGICNQLISALNLMISNGITLAGITSFKAWPTSQAEPPSQTGRGTYVSGAVLYNDRYHTTASNGTVTYNPLA